ncbi:MAG: tape measure protein [Alphaproteobacteria bacterium]|jgi:hypothetical protein|nr:tape measure protein [Alphaproteobacteria bacterium]
MSDLKVKLVLEALDRLTQPVRQMAARIRQFASQMNSAFRSVGQSMRNVGKSMSDIGGQMTAKVSTAIFGLGTASVFTSAKFEDLRAAMETAAGSAEDGNREFDRMLSFAETTPYQLEEVMTAYIKLKNLGLDPTNESLTSFGNTASAMNKSLDQMIEAVADATTGEFERLKEFGIKARVEGEKVGFTFQGQTTVVRNTAEEIEKYLLSIGNDKFGSAMEKRMRGMNGIISNFKDAVAGSLAGFGDDIIRELELKQFFKDLAQGVRDLLTLFRSLPQPIQGFIIKGGLVLALLGPLIMMVGQLFMGFGMLTIGISNTATGVVWLSGILKALTVFLWGATAATIKMGAAFMATPIGWITAAIAALAVAGFLIIKNWDKIRKFWTNLWGGIVQRVRTAAEYIMPVIEAISKGMDFITDNAVTRGIGRAADFVTGNDSDETSPVQGTKGQVDTGGELRIVIDENRRASVQATMNDKNTNTVIDQGVLMGAAL